MIAVWAAAVPFLPATLRTLDEAGARYVVLPGEPDTDSLARARDTAALIVGGSPVTGALLDSFPRLRLLVRGGVGVDRIDLDAASERRVLVTNVADYGTHEVADHALLLMLAATRRLADFTAQIRTDWHSVDRPPVPRPPVPRLAGARLGVIGLGRIGSAVAARAQAFGMQVAAYDPLIAPERFSRAGVDAVSLDELLTTSDVISLHAPLTPDSHHIVGPAACTLLRRGTVIVNTARGGLIDTAALIRALDDGVVGAAGLDVLEDESDVAAHAGLFDRSNVIITPHVAWYSQGSEHQLGRTAARIALDFIHRDIRPPGLNAQPTTDRTGEVTP